MRLPLVVLVVAAALTIIADSPPDAAVGPGSMDDPRRTGSPPAGPEPPATLVTTGGRAPDFNWMAEDGRWRRLRDLCAQGNVLLVFAPAQENLLDLQHERARLLDLGVLPVAVLDRSGRSTTALGRRLGLGYTLIADPRQVVSTQFNTLDPATVRMRPAWFVVDRSGRVRALDRSGLPRGGWTAIAAKALAIPLPGVQLPSGTK